MKRMLLFLAILLNVALATATEPDSVSQRQGPSVGFIGSFDTRVSTVASDAVGYLTLRGAVVLDRTWAFGLSGTGLYYEKRLSALTLDGTYHLMAGYGALTVERFLPLGEDNLLILGVAMGAGEAEYRYDREYRDAKPWYQETIDKSTFSVFEPSVGFHHQISRRLWLGAAVSYRFTSPLSLQGASSKLFQTFNGGLSLSYGVF